MNPAALPKLTVNRSFISAFIAAVSPCCALGLVEAEHRQYSLLALRPDRQIPATITAAGFNLGHTLYGNRDFQVVHFAFEFYGFATYNVLINPNHPVSRLVLRNMITSGDYFIFVLDENSGQVTAFRSNIEQDNLANLTANWVAIEQTMPTTSQYLEAVTHFARTPDPPGTLLHWVCHEQLDYLDLSKDRMHLNPG